MSCGFKDEIMKGFPIKRLPEKFMRELMIARIFGKQLVIVGHHYQSDDVIAHVDRVGDSLELARMMDDIEAKYVVFCGVHFMAESAALLARPGQQVFLPAPDASCVMSEMTPAALLEKVFESDTIRRKENCAACVCKHLSGGKSRGGSPWRRGMHVRERGSDDALGI